MLTLLWPFAREYLYDLTRRMDVPVQALPTIDKLQVQALVEERENSEE